VLVLALCGRANAACAVTLSPASSLAGPVKVTGEADGRALGAWNVTPGSAGAFLGRFDPGPCRVFWQLPGGQPEERNVVVENRPKIIAIR
jgi:hypothetical protein